MKVAIIHYWLVGMRGGEKVLEQICALYPQADIFTHVAIAQNLSDRLRAHDIHETFIARLPFARKMYQRYLPLMPRALESLDLRGYDLIISSEAGPAKGIIPGPDALHICYCHSPMRYIWDQYPVYRANAGRIARLGLDLSAKGLRVWDVASAARVDHFIANSAFVARRIRKYYRRDATVIAPPVDISAFDGADRKPGNHYLYVGELVGYKRPDLMIAAFRQSGRRLVIIGDGAARAALMRQASPNITFLGRADAATLRHQYATCRALIFPGIEDFGIVPLEAMASGRPVIAQARGGALETVIEGKTGYLFHDPTPEALNDAIARFEAAPPIAPAALRHWAAGFGPDVFRQKLADFIAAARAGHDPCK